jgi:hypothetical protein
MDRLRTGPQPSWQVRGSRSRVGVAAPPGAVFLVRTLVGDLDSTRRGSDTATRGRHVFPERSSAPNQPQHTTQRRANSVMPDGATEEYLGTEFTVAHDLWHEFGEPTRV